MHQRIPLAALLFSLLAAGCASRSGDWIVDSQEQWQAASARATNLAFTDGEAVPTAPGATYRSNMRRFGARQRAAAITIEQSPLWLNWEPIENLGPKNLKDAPVLLTLGPRNYWMFGRFGATGRPGDKPFVAEPATLDGFDTPLMTTPIANVFDAPGGLQKRFGGYHAWQSRDMQTWVHHGPVTKKFSRWVTSAEAADGAVYIFYDYPNDQDPHVYRDDDLFDGKPGENLGLAFDDPSDGSDAGFIRDLEGRFHAIYEDWSPINASKRSWDSPLAGHAVSEGPQGFEVAGAAIDHRTQATGEIGTYTHPHWHTHPDFESGLAEFEVHEPEQAAYGDWALICIGGRYYLFGDYDPVGGGKMACGWFTSDALGEPFTWCGQIGSGHPDPDICFAEGRFYLATQQNTDWVSDGPWVERVEVRVGVDTTDDGRSDIWSEWREVREAYDHVEGFSKQVSVAPARLDLESLPAGFGFQFELRITDATRNESKPIIDRVIVEFER